MFLLKLITFGVLLTWNVGAHSEVEEYYWKQYTGTVPQDAFPGGLDSQQRTTFIGLTVHTRNDGEAIPVPGQIIPAENKILYEWGRQEHEKTKNIMILCTHHPEQLSWVDISNVREYPQNYDLVSCGMEGKYQTHIGRIIVHKEVAVGKVHIIPNTGVGKDTYLHTTINGEYARFTDYQILVNLPNDDYNLA